MKRIIAIILAAVLTAAFIPLYTAAVEAQGTKYLALDVLKKEYWNKESGVSLISERRVSGNSAIYASATENATALSFYGGFRPLDLSAFSELTFDVSLKGDASEYTVTVTLSSESFSSAHTVESKNENCVFSIPLKDGVREALSRIDIDILANGSVSYATVSSVTADDTYTYAYLDSFMAKDISSDTPLAKSKDKISATSDNGNVSLTLDFVDKFEKDVNVLTWITLEKATTGTVSAKARYVDEENGTEEFFTAAPISASQGSVPFVIPGGYTDITFLFTNISSNAALVVTGAGCANMGKSEKSVGSITSCRYDGKKINISGSLSTEDSLQYMGSKLLLYMIPITKASNYSLEDYEPCATGSFSTKFTLSAECDPTYAQYFYKVVLDTDDGFISVGTLSGASCSASVPVAQGSLSTICGAGAADVFETNASRVIINVAAGNLLETNNIYSAVNYNYGTTYHFNPSYLSQLDNSIGFYNAAGVKVYIRLYSDKDGYTFDYSSENAESIALMSAVCSFLSERYPGICGFIMGSPLNASAAITPEKAISYAKLICAFSECVKSKNTSCEVVIPIDEKGSGDPRLLIAMLSYYLADLNAPSTVIMYETSSISSACVSAANSLSILSAQLGAKTDGCSVLWKVASSTTTEMIRESYRDLCIIGATYGIRFAAIDLTNTEKSSHLFDTLKETMDAHNVTTTTITQHKASTEDNDFSGTYPIWDFSSSYDTAGWVAGGSFSSPVSTRGSFSGRVLLSTAGKSSTGAGILIAPAKKSINMENTVARVRLSVFSKSAETADISVIFGSGDSRAEFSAVIPCNAESVLLCDMATFPGATNVDYSAIIVRGVADASAEISKVELCSTKLSHEEMKEKYAQVPEIEHRPLLYVTVIFIAAFTVTIFSVLLKSRKHQKKVERK